MITLALINNNTNICENVSTDTRALNEIQIEGYTVLNLNSTSTIIWSWNKELNDFEEIENIGNGGIGFIYTNGKLVQVKPEKPVKQDQPKTTGIESI